VTQEKIMSTTVICVVEDDPIMGESLADRFRLEGFDVDWHTDGESALNALQKRPYQAVISDIRKMRKHAIAVESHIDGAK
jgi:DNA-binding response OmpR family regulator